jgi:MFS superfamily sulfate permease-like transporter
LIGAARTPVRMVVLDCGAMFDLDVTGAETLAELARELGEQRIVLALAEPHAPMRRVLRRAGLLRAIGDTNVFGTVNESIRAYVARARAQLGRDVAWQRAEAPAHPGGEAP